MEEQTDVRSRINNVGKMSGGNNKVFSCRAMGMNIKRRLYEAVLTALYGIETCCMAVVEKTN